MQLRPFNITDNYSLHHIEYRSLKLLLKIVTCKSPDTVVPQDANRPQAYFFGIHLFGAICLVGWIQTANPKYTEYLQSTGQDKNWW
jgi:hypothetical protein